MMIWRAFYTKPRHEKKIVERLEGRYQRFCPIREERVRWSDRWKIVKKPLIPGYLFAKVEEDERLALLCDPSILRTVSWLGQLAEIKEEEIHAMKVILGMDDVEDFRLETLISGDRVEVTGGEFRKLKGVIVTLHGERASIRIDSIHCNFTFRIKTSLLEKLTNKLDVQSAGYRKRP